MDSYRARITDWTSNKLKQRFNEKKRIIYGFVTTALVHTCDVCVCVRVCKTEREKP